MDGNHLLIDLAGGRRKGATLGLQPRAYHCPRAQRLFRNTARGDVRRTVRNSEPGRDRICLVVRGRRSLSVGLLLETRQRQDLLFPSRSRVVPDLLSARNTNGDSKCRELGRTGWFTLGGFNTER